VLPIVGHLFLRYEPSDDSEAGSLGGIHLQKELLIIVASVESAIEQIISQ